MKKSCFRCANNFWFRCSHVIFWVQIKLSVTLKKIHYVLVCGHRFLHILVEAHATHILALHFLQRLKEFFLRHSLFIFAFCSFILEIFFRLRAAGSSIIKFLSFRLVRNLKESQAKIRQSNFHIFKISNLLRSLWDWKIFQSCLFAAWLLTCYYC